VRRRLISEHIQFHPFHPSLYTVTDPSGPSGGPIDQSVVSRLLEQDQIWAERGKAIQSYALLEQSLNMLFSQLSDTTESVAGTIFYKISNASARNSIIEKLLKTKYNAKFNLFWNSYLKLLRPIDLRRNEIVHWVAASISQLDDSDTIVCGTILIPSNVHSFFPAMKYLCQTDLTEFSAKCDEFARLCNIFRRVSKPDTSQLQFDAWLHIFQRPLTYPLPADHLLYKMPSTP
jgi:hypothetical protein